MKVFFFFNCMGARACTYRNCSFPVLRLVLLMTLNSAWIGMIIIICRHTLLMITQQVSVYPTNRANTFR